MASQKSGPRQGEDPVSAERRSRLTDHEKEILRTVAWDSIRLGLKEGRALKPKLEALPPALEAPGAAFVTLNLQGRLRGCVGSFEACRPLAEDVARNAYSAAFMDFRFPSLSPGEFPDLDLHISLLAPMEPLEVGSREELLRSLHPGVDGLLLEDPPHRAIFLPQVWDSLTDPDDFLGELFLKAGLGRDHWSASVRFHRYGVEEF